MSCSEINTTKVNDIIPLCEPLIKGNEWKYIKECLDTGWVSSVGCFVDKFEENICEYIGTKYAVATVNGTAALHIALLVAGVKSDEEVLVSSLSFIAPANAIHYVGAYPVFIDCESTYWQIDPNVIQDFFEKRCTWKNGSLFNSVSGKRIAAILPVHILGHPVDIDPIYSLAEKYDLPVVEDTTEALGSIYRDRKVGSKGHIACFSFNGNKIITSGGGGMIVTGNQAWAEKSKYLITQAKDDPLEYIHNEVGYNYRLTNIQAAMGCAQLENIESYIRRKREIAKIYTKKFEKISGIESMSEARYVKSSYWLFSVLVDENNYGCNSRSLMKSLIKKGIQCRPLWKPLYMSPVYKSCQYVGGDNSKNIYHSALSIPCSVGLTIKDHNYTIENILKISNE